MLPARKTSKSRKRLRRSHHALSPVNLSTCPQCSAAKLPHAACAGCGYVNPATRIEIEESEEA
ncbi:MAG: 50S ribosomal protein L32 [Phycisphaerae bacterium]|nr:50S ribosomal protein L32 [Phycisphaerae bacterium]